MLFNNFVKQAMNVIPEVPVENPVNPGQPAADVVPEVPLDGGNVVPVDGAHEEVYENPVGDGHEGLGVGPEQPVEGVIHEEVHENPADQQPAENNVVIDLLKECARVMFQVVTGHEMPAPNEVPMGDHVEGERQFNVLNDQNQILVFVDGNAYCIVVSQNDINIKILEVVEGEETFKEIYYMVIDMKSWQIQHSFDNANVLLEQNNLQAFNYFLGQINQQLNLANEFKLSNVYSLLGKESRIEYKLLSLDIPGHLKNLVVAVLGDNLIGIRQLVQPPVDEGKQPQIDGQVEQPQVVFDPNQQLSTLLLDQSIQYIGLIGFDNLDANIVNNSKVYALNGCTIDGDITKSDMKVPLILKGNTCDSIDIKFCENLSVIDNNIMGFNLNGLVKNARLAFSQGIKEVNIGLDKESYIDDIRFADYVNGADIVLNGFKCGLIEFNGFNGCKIQVDGIVFDAPGFNEGKSILNLYHDNIDGIFDKQTGIVFNVCSNNEVDIANCTNALIYGDRNQRGFYDIHGNKLVGIVFKRCQNGQYVIQSNTTEAADKIIGYIDDAWNVGNRKPCSYFDEFSKTMLTCGAQNQAKQFNSSECIFDGNRVLNNFSPIKPRDGIFEFKQCVDGYDIDWGIWMQIPSNPNAKQITFKSTVADLDDAYLVKQLIALRVHKHSIETVVIEGFTIHDNIFKYLNQFKAIEFKNCEFIEIVNVSLGENINSITIDNCRYPDDCRMNFNSAAKEVEVFIVNHPLVGEGVFDDNSVTYNFANGNYQLNVNGFNVRSLIISGELSYINAVDCSLFVVNTVVDGNVINTIVNGDITLSNTTVAFDGVKCDNIKCTDGNVFFEGCANLTANGVSGGILQCEVIDCKINGKFEAIVDAKVGDDRVLFQNLKAESVVLTGYKPPVVPPVVEDAPIGEEVPVENLLPAANVEVPVVLPAVNEGAVVNPLVARKQIVLQGINGGKFELKDLDVSTEQNGIELESLKATNCEFNNTNMNSKGQKVLLDGCSGTMDLKTSGELAVNNCVNLNFDSLKCKKLSVNGQSIVKIDSVINGAAFPIVVDKDSKLTIQDEMREFVSSMDIVGKFNEDNTIDLSKFTNLTKIKLSGAEKYTIKGIATNLLTEIEVSSVSVKFDNCSVEANTITIGKDVKFAENSSLTINSDGSTLNLNKNTCANLKLSYSGYKVQDLTLKDGRLSCLALNSDAKVKSNGFKGKLTLSGEFVLDTDIHIKDGMLASISDKGCIFAALSSVKKVDIDYVYWKGLDSKNQQKLHVMPLEKITEVRQIDSWADGSIKADGNPKFISNKVFMEVLNDVNGIKKWPKDTLDAITYKSGFNTNVKISYIENIAADTTITADNKIFVAKNEFASYVKLFDSMIVTGTLYCVSGKNGGADGFYLYTKGNKGSDKVTEFKAREARVGVPDDSALTKWIKELEVHDKIHIATHDALYAFKDNIPNDKLSLFKVDSNVDKTQFTIGQFCVKTDTAPDVNTYKHYVKIDDFEKIKSNIIAEYDVYYVSHVKVANDDVIGIYLYAKSKTKDAKLVPLIASSGIFDFEGINSKDYLVMSKASLYSVVVNVDKAKADTIKTNEAFDETKFNLLVNVSGACVKNADDTNGEHYFSIQGKNEDEIKTKKIESLKKITEKITKAKDTKIDQLYLVKHYDDSIKRVIGLMLYYIKDNKLSKYQPETDARETKIAEDKKKLEEAKNAQKEAQKAQEDAAKKAKEDADKRTEELAALEAEQLKNAKEQQEKFDKEAKDHQDKLKAEKAEQDAKNKKQQEELDSKRRTTWVIVVIVFILIVGGFGVAWWYGVFTPKEKVINKEIIKEKVVIQEVVREISNNNVLAEEKLVKEYSFDASALKEVDGLWMDSGGKSYKLVRGFYVDVDSGKRYDKNNKLITEKSIKITNTKEGGYFIDDNDRFYKFDANDQVYVNVSNGYRYTQDGAFVDIIVDDSDISIVGTQGSLFVDEDGRLYRFSQMDQIYINVDNGYMYGVSGGFIDVGSIDESDVVIHTENEPVFLDEDKDLYIFDSSKKIYRNLGNNKVYNVYGDFVGIQKSKDDSLKVL